MTKMRRRIKVTMDQRIGWGSYQQVYKISPRRVVKVSSPLLAKWKQDFILEDEIKGSKTLEYALPVLDIVDVELPDGKVTKGTVRRYIPNELDYKRFRKFQEGLGLHDWDSHEGNFRTDSRGFLWRIDTQTESPD